MNNINLLDFVTKLILLQNDRVRDFYSNMSKVKTLVHAGQLYRQIEDLQSIALFASSCLPSYERSKILEQCNHGKNDCYNELERLTKEVLREKAIERYTNMRRGNKAGDV